MDREQRKKDIALNIVTALRSRGFTAYFAGGCVRDLILGREPYDYDVATDASPDEIEKMFPQTIPVGKQFGVILAIIEGMQFEVAVFRKEGGYQDGRRPSWIEAGTPQEDAGRRDFTINGLFFDPIDGIIIDHVDGQRDIERKILRTIGDPDHRFEEDKLRLLRAVRFASNLAFEIEPGTWDVVKRRAGQIHQVSAERVRDELIKIFTGANAGRGLRLLSESGLLRELLPEVEAMRGCEQPKEFHPEGDVFAHTALLMERLDNPTVELAFGALLHDVGKPSSRTENGSEVHFYRHEQIGAEITRQILTRLRFSNKEIDVIAQIVENHMRFMHVKEMRRGKLKMLLGRTTFPDELTLHRIDCESSHGMLDNYEFLKRTVEEFGNEELKPKPFLNGHDLIAMGYVPGPQMGEMLEALYESQMEGTLGSKEEASEFVRQKWVRAGGPDMKTNIGINKNHENQEGEARMTPQEMKLERDRRVREYYSGKSVLVAGGAGFLGSHLVEFLLEDGAKVRVADNLERGNIENLSEVRKDIEFIQLDLRDRDMTRRAVKGMDVVINMAAKVTGIHYNRLHHGDMFTQNVLISANTLEFARLNRVGRFTVVSSACIYPHDSLIPTPESEGLRGTPEPTNEGYGWAKRMAEKQGEYYANEYGMEVAIVRPFNAYGRRDYFDEATSHVIPALIKKIMDGSNPVSIWGSGNQSRVFVHGRDFAKGIEIVTALHAKADPVNIGHDQEITIRDLFFKLCEILGKNPAPFFDANMPEGYLRRAADTSKLKRVTCGWEPEVRLEDGLREMVEWYLQKNKSL